MKPLSIGDIIDNEVQNLSGGELQRTAIALALGTPADIYLIDEPSAYLDSEQVRLVLVRLSRGMEVMSLVMCYSSILGTGPTQRAERVLYPAFETVCSSVPLVGTRALASTCPLNDAAATCSDRRHALNACLLFYGVCEANSAYRCNVHVLQ